MKLLTFTLTGMAALSVAAAGAPAVAAATPPIVRVSVSSAGGQAEPTPAQLKEPGVHRMHSEEVSVSAGGRFAVFTSNAVNLVPGDTNGAFDVFMRDIAEGVTTRVNVSDSGAQTASGFSGEPSMSADGRYVAFTSYAADLVPGDTNDRSDVFVRDTVANTTARVSVSATGQQDTGSSSDGVISADGRFVAYVTYRSDLISDSGPVSNVVVKDLATGALTLASEALGGGPLVDDGYGIRDLAVSRDGSKVAFITRASNLVAGDTNGAYDVFVRDLVAKVTTRVNIAVEDAQANGSSENLAMTPDGRFIAYDSLASNLVIGDTDRREDVFVRDLVAGTTSLVAAGARDGDSSNPSISDDGGLVSFLSATPGPHFRYDVFVHDLAADTTTLVSGPAGGGLANEASMEPSISGDGAFVAFSSYASNLVDGDTNQHKDVFVRRLG